MELEVKEITAAELNVKQFIEAKVKEIAETVGEGTAINALSGGVDSSVAAVLLKKKGFFSELLRGFYCFSENRGCFLKYGWV